MKRAPAFLLAAAALLATPGASWAETHRDAALGFSGEIYLVQTGFCAELFDQCAEGAEAFPVLALDIVQAGHSPRRLLVPGTLGPEIEDSPSVLYEDRSDSLFVVWESKVATYDSRLNLVRLTGEEWSDVFEISGDIGPLKGSPKILLTRDNFQLPDELAATSHVRSVVHVLWWEQGPSAERVFYTPVILVDGNYLGHNDVFDLTSLGTQVPPPADAPTVPAALRQSPALEPGDDERAIVIGFVHPISLRFLTFESRVLPVELSDLGDQVERAMLANKPLYGSNVTSFADRIRSQMIEVGQRFQPGLLAILADDVRAAILAAPHVAGALPSLAEKIRSQMIEVGARNFHGDGLVAPPKTEVATLLETRPAGAPGGASTPPHTSYIRLVSDRPAPSATVGTPAWFFLSGDARRAIVAWQGDGYLRYSETRGQTWTTLRQIVIDGPVDADRAEQILRQRLRDR